MISQYMTQNKLVKHGGLLEPCAMDRMQTLKNNSPHPYCSRRRDPAMSPRDGMGSGEVVQNVTQSCR